MSLYTFTFSKTFRTGNLKGITVDNQILSNCSDKNLVKNGTNVTCFSTKAIATVSNVSRTCKHK